jgi:hypothetical protein
MSRLLEGDTLDISFAIYHPCGVFDPMKMPRQFQLQSDQSSARTDCLPGGHYRGHLCALIIWNRQRPLEQRLDDVSAGALVLESDPPAVSGTVTCGASVRQRSPAQGAVPAAAAASAACCRRSTSANRSAT